jgi:hypothetical protein
MNHHMVAAAEGGHHVCGAGRRHYVATSCVFGPGPAMLLQLWPTLHSISGPPGAQHPCVISLPLAEIKTHECDLNLAVLSRRPHLKRSAHILRIVKQRSLLNRLCVCKLYKSKATSATLIIDLAAH